jgi:hypothetical protein
MQVWEYHPFAEFSGLIFPCGSFYALRIILHGFIYTLGQSENADRIFP